MLQLDAGGSERVVFDLARSLDPDKFEVFVASFKGGVLAEPLKKFCKDIFIIDKHQGLDITAMFKLAKIIREYRIDVVNAHHYMPCFYSFLGTRLLNGKRLVYTEHSVPEVENIANCVHGKIFHWMLYRVNSVVGVSGAITSKFREMYPRHADKFHEVLNAVEIEKFRGKGTREIVRGSFGLESDHFVIGIVANFRKVKNHICMVRAAARLKYTHPQLRLFFVGTGFPGDAENSEEEVQTLISDLGLKERVIFAGYREDIPVMLSAIDAFCLPSFSEGLPVSLLEAMAAGVPVIGSDVSGIAEVVTHGKTGLLFSSDNDAQLSQLFAKIMAGPDILITLANNGFEYVKNNHSYKSWHIKYQNLFSQ